MPCKKIDQCLINRKAGSLKSVTLELPRTASNGGEGVKAGAVVRL
jgi:hypothetical protein